MAELGPALAGVVAVRDGTHLFHLFLASEFQRQGIARCLWAHAMQAARSAGRVEAFSVNSSLFAVSVYGRLGFGFVVCGERVEQHGVAFVPMRMTPPGVPGAPA